MNKARKNTRKQSHKLGKQQKPKTRHVKSRRIKHRRSRKTKRGG